MSIDRASGAALLWLFCLGTAGCQQSDAQDWSRVAPGLELGRFPIPVAQAPEDGEPEPAITILRIEPSLWELKLLSASGTGSVRNRTVKQWCRDFDLAAAINAGMFDVDYTKHTGYLRVGEHVNNGARNSYQSLAVFGPRQPDLPPFRLHDLDELGESDFDRLDRQYETVVQNLRLIKRARENRWQPQQKRWSEAALGEDGQGRVLFIFCRQPFSMHDLNEHLLGLPIDLVCAQHLEGGPEAQLYLRHGQTLLDLVGGFETGFHEAAGNKISWPVPNVIGIVPRKP